MHPFVDNPKRSEFRDRDKRVVVARKWINPIITISFI